MLLKELQDSLALVRRSIKWESAFTAEWIFAGEVGGNGVRRFGGQIEPLNYQQGRVLITDLGLFGLEFRIQDVGGREFPIGLRRIVDPKAARTGLRELNRCGCAELLAGEKTVKQTRDYAEQKHEKN